MSGTTSGGAVASAHSLVVRTRRVGGAPVVAVRVWLRGGARAEEIPGQSLVTGRMLTEGSRRRPWRRIVDQAEGRGMALNGFGGFSGFGLAIDALARDLDLALTWAAELSLEPTFPVRRCAWQVRQTRAELDSLADQPEVVAGWEFLRQLYEPHPRARPLQGSHESLARLVPAACAELHGRGLGWGTLVTVAGEIDEERARSRVLELFAPAEHPPARQPSPPAPRGLPEPRRQVRVGGQGQCHFYAGQLTVRRDDPDFPALLLAGVVLGAGAGLTGRIPQRIRERDGLAYTAHAEAVAGAGLDPGHLSVYLGTSRETLARAERAVVEELRRLVDDGVGEEEVEAARSYLIGRDPFRRETARQWADILAEAELFGLPIDRPEWVLARLAEPDRAAVDAAVRRHLDPERLRITVGMPGRRVALVAADP